MLSILINAFQNTEFHAHQQGCILITISKSEVISKIFILEK